MIKKSENKLEKNSKKSKKIEKGRKNGKRNFIFSSNANW